MIITTIVSMCISTFVFVSPTTVLEYLKIKVSHHRCFGCHDNFIWCPFYEK